MTQRKKSYSVSCISSSPKGRRIAIGDIHGCVNTLQALIEKINLKKEDTLFLLGDLIDKGLYSKQVVNFVLQLKKENFNVLVVKGNHEESFLTAYNCGWSFFVNYLEQNNTDGFLGSDLESYLQFFAEMEYAYDLGDWLVSHTEFLVSERSLYRGMRGLFSKVDFDIDSKMILKRRQITGHFVTSISEIRESIASKSRVICIDNGCVYVEEQLGHLCAFDLDSFELILQRNID
ncbi:MAG: metallophosphoesterase [Chitinophagales bacterium]